MLMETNTWEWWSMERNMDLERKSMQMDRIMKETTKMMLHQGQGKYVWNDGLTYEGEWLHGNFNGKGKKTSPDGTYYTGDWKNGIPHGWGKCRFEQIGIEYEGEWKNGLQQGSGVLYNEKE